MCSQTDITTISGTEKLAIVRKKERILNCITEIYHERKNAINQRPWVLKNGIVLHSDQGSQYTSKEFTDYCATHNVAQSMSRAGCPYDNAPTERYFNTLKSELIYQHSYTSENKLFSDIEDYVLLWYNSIRPHSFNNGLIPWQKRLS